MPSTVSTLLRDVGLSPSGVVRWGEPVSESRTGVYLVSLSPSTRRSLNRRARCPANNAALDELLEVCPALRLDGAKPDRLTLRRRLSRFWLPDESILYIGLAGQPLGTRIRQYYRTPLGAAKPHAGGWWLKTLSCLQEIWVHFAVARNFKNAEEGLQNAFAKRASAASKESVPGPVMPFANLRDGEWQRKPHGITGATQRV